MKPSSEMPEANGASRVLARQSSERKSGSGMATGGISLGNDCESPSSTTSRNEDRASLRPNAGVTGSGEGQ